MKIGLSLGGGGARGLSHIVVFEVLDELGVKVDRISGSSIGALMGMGYADGMTGREIRAYTLETFSDSARVLSQLWSLRPASFQSWFNPKSYSLGQIDPEKILSLFTPVEQLPGNLENIRTPLCVVATDFYQWNEVCFTKGNLKQIVAASIAIPFVFKPVVIDDAVLIDGNITNPLPFDKLDDDCDFVIAVDVVGGPAREDDATPSGMDVMLGASQIMMQSITQAKLIKGRRPDVLIAPPIEQFNVFDFLKASTILRVSDNQREAIKRSIADGLEEASRNTSG